MQRCSLIMKKRKRGPDVWLLRWSDKSDSGRRIYRKRVIGTVEEFVDADSARRAVASLVEKINGDNPRISLRTITMSALCSHFERCELAQGNTWRSYSTKKCYAGYLKRWIVPQWGKYELRNIKTIEVESWLRRLPLAKGSCAKIRGVMSVLFNHACRYELFDRNPIQLVRQGAKRKKTPCVLTPAEIRVLADGLAVPLQKALHNNGSAVHFDRLPSVSSTCLGFRNCVSRPDCSAQFLQVSVCALLMPIEHQS
jgi:integrase